MVTEQLNIEVEKFLRNFSFVKFEIYSFFGNNVIYWIHSKGSIFEDMDYKDEDVFDMIETLRSRNWTIYDEKKALKYMVSEFNLFSQVFSSKKNKIADIKLVFKNILESEKLVKTIKFSPLIKDLIMEGRHSTKNIYPEEIKYRENVTTQIGDKVYFCDSSSNIANPGYVLATDLVNEKVKIAYFTNLNNDNLETRNLSINGWACAKVQLNEIGLSPQQAVKHRQY